MQGSTRKTRKAPLRGRQKKPALGQSKAQMGVVVKQWYPKWGHGQWKGLKPAAHILVLLCPMPRFTSLPMWSPKKHARAFVALRLDPRKMGVCSSWVSLQRPQTKDSPRTLPARSLESRVAHGVWRWLSEIPAGFCMTSVQKTSGGLGLSSFPSCPTNHRTTPQKGNRLSKPWVRGHFGLEVCKVMFTLE